MGLLKEGYSMKLRITSREELMTELDRRDRLRLPKDWRAELYQGDERIGIYQAFGIIPPGIVYIDLDGRHDKLLPWSFFDEGGYIWVDDGQPTTS